MADDFDTFIDNNIAANPVPEKQADPFDAFIDQELLTRNEGAVKSLLSTEGGNPDQAARAKALSPEVGIPASVIESDMPEFEKQAELTRNRRILEKNPVLAGWAAANPESVRIARDDFENLGFIEKTTKALAAGSESALAQDRLGRAGNIRQLGALAGIATPEADLAAASARQTLQANKPIEGGFKYVQALSEFVVGTAQNIKMGASAGAVAGGAVGAPGGLPGIGTGAIAGAIVGFNADAALVAAGQAYDQLDQARDRTGAPLSEDSKQVGSLFVGVANYALSKIGVNTTTGIAKESIEVFTRDAVTEAMTRPTVQRAIANAGKSIAKGGVQGAALNAAMQATFQAGEVIAQQIDGGEFDSVFNDPETRERYLMELADAAEMGAVLFGGLSAIGAGTRLVGESYKARQAEMDVQTMQSLMDGAEQSKTFLRSKDTFAEFLRAQTDGTPVENVFIPAERVMELYQSAKLDPAENDGLFGFVPDIAQQIEQGIATGGDVVIPMADFIKNVAGTDIGRDILPDLRLRQDGWTQREAEAFNQNYDANIRETADNLQGVIERDADITSGRQQVFDEIFNQLRLAGRSVDEATTGATLYASRYATRAERNQMEFGDALDEFRRENIQIQRELPESVKYIPVDQTDLMLNILRDGKQTGTDKQIFGDSLVDFIKKRGGIEEEGGELKAIGADKVRGLVRRSRQDRGRSLPGMENLPPPRANSIDNVALAAWEAGYLPELNEQPTIDQMVQALREELSGKKRYATQNIDQARADFRASVENLDEFLGSIGVDIKTASNAEIKAAIRAYQQEADGKTFNQSERGKIIIGESQKIIKLFADADQSTFLHETGHSFLFELNADALREGASQQLKDDLASVKKWLEVDDILTMPEEKHEQFARGFEAKLMEGKAPSNALDRVFQNFKAWLNNIYRDIRGLNVPINDEIRGVMDRLLATDEEIALARDAQGMNPLFRNSADAGMTQAEFAAYTNGLRNEQNEASDRLLKHLMEDIRRQRTKEWKEEFAAVSDDVERQVRARNDIQALSYLRSGKLLNQPDAEQILKLSRDELVRMFGHEEVLANLPKGVYAKEGGIHPDLIAQNFGYNSGEAMVKALLSLEEQHKFAQDQSGKKLGLEAFIKKLTKDETQEIMESRHGNALTDGSIEIEAIAALHSDKRSTLLSTEMRYLARQIGGENALSVEQIRTWAAGQISDMPVKRALNLGQFSRAEAKAALEAQRFLLKGDVTKAFEAKQRQLVNHEMYRAAKEASDFYEKSQKQFTRLARNKTLASMSQEFLDQIHGILVRIGQPVKRENSELLQTLRETSLNDFVAAQEAAGQEMLIPTFLLDPNYAKKTDNMSMDEFRTVAEAIQSMAYVGREQKLFKVEGDKLAMLQVVDEMRDTLGDRVKEVTAGLTEAVTDAERRRVDFKSILGNLTTVETWSKVMDKGKQDGPFTRYVVRPIFDATANYRTAQIAKLEELRAIIAPRRENLIRGKVDAPEINYTFTNKGELIHAITHTGNESNLKKLLVGRGWGEPIKGGGVDRSRYDAMIARMISDGTLTKDDFDMAQQIRDLMESVKPDAQKAHKEMYGTYFSEVANQEFTVTFGNETVTYRGGYMPAIVDRFMVEDGQARQDSESLKLQASGSMFPTTGKGFTNSRVENYLKPLELNLALIPSHLDQVLRFTHINPAVRNAGRLMINKDFRRMMNGVDPSVVSTMLIPWLERTARQSMEAPSLGVDGRFADKVLRAARRNAGLQMLALNVVNTLQNVAGIPVGVLKSSTGAAMRSLVTYMRNPSAAVDDTVSRSPYMKNRIESKSYELVREIENSFKDLSKLQEARNWTERNGYILQHMTQSFVDVTVWRAAYEHNTRNGLSEADAIYAADSAVRLTQGGLQPEEVSKFLTGSPLKRLFTQMYSYFNTQGNLIVSEVALARQTGGREALKRYGAIALFGVAIPSMVADILMKSLSGQWRDWDEDDAMAEDMQSLFLGAPLKYTASTIPLVSPVLMTWFADEPGDRIGSVPAVGTIKQAARAPISIADAVFDDGKASKAAKDTLVAIGLFTGLPLGQLGKPIGYGLDVATGEVEPETAGDVARGIISGKQETKPK